LQQFIAVEFIAARPQPKLGLFCAKMQWRENNHGKNHQDNSSHPSELGLLYASVWADSPVRVLQVTGNVAQTVQTV
jgi:hypothetical protein